MKKTLREIDALVAVTVMGWKWKHNLGGWIQPDYVVLASPNEHPKATEFTGDFGDKRFTFASYAPFYSTDIGAAWQVVEKMHSQAVIQQHKAKCECQAATAKTGSK